MSLMTNMSRNLQVFVFVFMFAATMGGTAQGFSIKMFPVLSANLTLAEKYQTLTQISKARALHLQVTMSTNSSEPLVPNTIRSLVRHAFSDFFYTEIYIGTPPQKANLHIDTGSSITWVQGKECQTCFPVSIPNFDGKQSTTCRAMLANNPLCVLPDLSPYHGACSYFLEYADGSTTEGLFGLEKFTFLSEQGQQAIPNVPYGLGLDNHVNFNDRYHGQPNPISGSMGLGRSHPTNILQQLNQITLQRFSYCLPPQFESQPSLLHFGNDAEIRGSTNVLTTPILGSPNDHYYVRLNAISFNGQRLQIDPNLFSRGGSGIIVDSGSPYTLIVDDAFNILSQQVVDYFHNMYGWQPIPKGTSDEFDLCYRNTPTVFTTPSVMLHFDGGDLKVHKPTLFQHLESKNEFCMTILSRRDNNGPNLVGAAQQVNYRFLFDVGARRLSFGEENCGRLE